MSRRFSVRGFGCRIESVELKVKHDPSRKTEAYELNIMAIQPLVRCPSSPCMAIQELPLKPQLLIIPKTACVVWPAYALKRYTVALSSNHVSGLFLILPRWHDI